MKRGIRLATWALQVTLAALMGLVARSGRSLVGRPPRVLHGLSNFVGNKYLVRASRLAGFPSHSAVWYWHRHAYDLVRDEDFDHVIGGPEDAENDLHWMAFIHVLRHADIWVTFFEGLFFHRDQEAINSWSLRLLKLMRIRIVVQPHGNDMIYRSRFRTRYDWVERMQLDYPSWDLAANTAVAQRRIRLFSRYADLVIAGAWYVAPLLPRNDLVFHSVPLDCEELRPEAKNLSARPPVIIHSPNHRNVKGSDYLIKAVNRLSSAGLTSDLRIIEKVPRHLALDLYKAADITADQFCIGTIGVFALEAMALGKPVIAYIDHAHLGDPVFNHPVVNTNPENLEQVLAVLIEVPALRERLGRAGRESVEKYQSIPALAEVWGRIYHHVWSGAPLDLETTQHFSAERKARSFSENPAHPDFWPVPVTDLMVDILDALKRVSPEVARTIVTG